jgi:AbrB family looped-hinge helix DNA binding protein
MKVTTKGQVTIPQDIREKLGMLPGSEVEFMVRGNAVKIVRAKDGESRGWKLVERIRGRGTVKMTTDEIMALMRGE